jgi:hypothetical protein
MATYYPHPPFDPRIYTLTWPVASQRAGGLTRGYMTWHQPPPGYSKSQTGQIRFLYNPSTIGTSYSLMTDSNGLAALMTRNAGDRANPLLQIQQSTSFALLYDRTFELWGSYNADGTPANDGGVNDPHTEGVGVDILAMKQFTGMLVDAPSGKGNANSGTPPVQQGPMLLVEAWVYFGSPNGIYYYGYVTDWQVQVTHWTQYMVPMRCVINVDFMLLPPPKKTTPDDTKWWSLSGLGSGGTPPDTRIVASLGSTTTGRSGR